MTLKITLEGNGLHSFIKGLESFKDYENDVKKDDFLLKEAIMFLHHGIELLMKQVLLNNGGEYLIFSDISNETVKKISKAKKEKISVFNLTRPPHTATFIESIERIKAFVDIPILPENLETWLRELNSLRNNLEHYGIETEKSEVERLILNIRKPISIFFRGGNVKLGSEYDKKWESLEESLIVKISGIRGSGSIKTARIQGKVAIIEFVKDYKEYKEIQPQSTLDEDTWAEYWNHRRTVLKMLNDSPVRLLRKIDNLEEVQITLPTKDRLYKITVKKEALEAFLGFKMTEIREDWDNTFSNKYVYTDDGLEEFFSKFGSESKI